jgi:hypothetical protein
MDTLETLVAVTMDTLETLVAETMDTLETLVASLPPSNQEAGNTGGFLRHASVGAARVTPRSTDPLLLETELVADSEAVSILPGLLDYHADSLYTVGAGQGSLEDANSLTVGVVDACLADSSPRRIIIHTTDTSRTNSPNISAASMRMSVSSASLTTRDAASLSFQLYYRIHPFYFFS